MRDSPYAAAVGLLWDHPATAAAKLIKRYDSVDNKFAIINGAEWQDPSHPEATYAGETSVLQSVDTNISELMGDEKLNKTVSEIEALGH